MSKKYKTYMYLLQKNYFTVKKISMNKASVLC